MSRVFRKPMQLETRTESTGAGQRPTATYEAPVTVYGATRHRLDDRAADGGEIIKQEQLVYLEPSVAIAPGDRLTFDGIAWEVVGEPFRAFSQRHQVVHHLEVRVRVGRR